MKRTVATALAAFALATTTFAAVGHAGNRKTYPASGCVPGYEHESGYYDVDGRYFNTASDFRYLMCPVINDKEQSENVLTSIDVNVIDQSYTYDISCRLMEHINTWTGWNPASTTVGTNPNPQKVSMVVGGNLGISLYAMCTIPQPYNTNKSGIDSYTVIETD